MLTIFSKYHQAQVGHLITSYNKNINKTHQVKITLKGILLVTIGVPMMLKRIIL